MSNNNEKPGSKGGWRDAGPINQAGFADAVRWEAYRNGRSPLGLARGGLSGDLRVVVPEGSNGIDGARLEIREP